MYVLRTTAGITEEGDVCIEDNCWILSITEEGVFHTTKLQILEWHFHKAVRIA